MDEISPASLRGREGQVFRFTDAQARSAELSLVEIDEQAEDLGGLMYVTFRADEPHGLPQGTYDVAHHDLASTPLFTVPASDREVCVTFTWLTSPPDGAS